jgi:hypothetical protein
VTTKKSSAGAPTSPLPTAAPTASPASTTVASAPAVAPAVAPAPKPRSAAAAVIEKEIEENLLAYQKSREDIVVLEADLDDLKDRYPRQYAEVSSRLGIEEEQKNQAFVMPDFSSFKVSTTVLQLFLIAVLVIAIVWTWFNNPEQGFLPTLAETVGFETTPESAEIVSIPTPTYVVVSPTSEAVATATAEATVEATAVPTAVPPTAVPPTAVPPTAVPPTAVPLPIFWNSNEFRVFEVGADGAVCSGDKVAGVSGDEVDGVKGPVTIAFPPNYGNVEVVWGRCVVNGGTAQQIADEDTKNHKKQFVVKEAP